MKSLLAVASLALFISYPCAAQRRGPGGVTFVTPSGFGNVLYPGTGGPNVSFPSRLGATVAGSPLYTARPRGRSTGFYGGYPLYVGGGYVPSYAPDYSGQTQLAPAQNAAPPVIINQYFTPPQPMEPITAPPSSTIYQPSMERQQEQQEAAAPAPKYYLLAFKDHSVYTALAYWVEDKTLHYVTTQNTHNQASLDLVDVPFTEQLNRDRDVPFTLQGPPPQPAH
jgi:hypothetical protein